MLNYCIATFVCVDTRPSDAQVVYPMLGHSSADERRALYWRMAVTCILTASKANVGTKHVVYTNDNDAAIFGGTDLRAFLEGHGVEVIYLAFETFKFPTGMSLRLSNAFYRYEVMREMSEHGGGVVLDSDVLWVRNADDMEEMMDDGKLLIYDLYDRSDRPTSRKPHGVSMADMGHLFEGMYPGYPIKYPVWLGSEVVAGNGFVFAEIVEMAEEICAKYKVLHHKGAEAVTFPNGTGFFNNDEFLFSFLANKFGRVEYLNPYLKRTYALSFLNNLEAKDQHLAMWHAPAEKNTGLALLFDEVMDMDSEFWKLEEEEWAIYIGGFVGVPKRTRSVPIQSTVAEFMRTVRGKVGNLIRNI